MQHAVGGAGIGLVKNGGGAVLLLQLDHFLRDMVERLIPGNALELALTAFANPHHRVEQSLRRIQATAIGAPTQAGTQLRLFLGIEADLSPLLITPVVG